MRVSFHATVDEITDAHLRLLLESNAGRRDRAIGSVMTAIASAGVVFFFMRRLTWLIAMPMAVLAGGLGYGLFGREYRKIARKRVRKVVVEQLGHETPVAISVTIDPDALVVEQLDSTIRFGWDRITDLKDLPPAVELRAIRPISLMRVPARAFPSMSDRAAFVRLLREHLPTG